MSNRFEACVAFTRREEGGYVADPRDSGNWSGGRVGLGRLIGSNMGVGAPMLCSWMGPDITVDAVLMRNLPVSTYDAIAQANFWSVLGCEALPPGLDLMVFDFAWNRGVAASRSVFRRCLGAPPSATILDRQVGAMPPVALLKQFPPCDVKFLQKLLGTACDGIMGPLTLDALRLSPKCSSVVATLALYHAQIRSYRALGNFAIYGEGWLRRTVRRRSESLSALGLEIEDGQLAA